MTVVMVRGGGGGRTQRDRRQPWFGAGPEEGLWLMESRGTRKQGREREKKKGGVKMLKLRGEGEAA